MTIRMVCENGHGYSEEAGFESCFYCGKPLVKREYTEEDVLQTFVWHSAKLAEENAKAKALAEVDKMTEEAERAKKEAEANAILPTACPC